MMALGTPNISVLNVSNYPIYIYIFNEVMLSFITRTSDRFGTE